MKLRILTTLAIIAFVSGTVNAATLSEQGINALKAKDYSAAAKFFRQGAEASDAASQYWLGYLYSRGLGLPKDSRKAVTLTLQAADQDYPRALYTMGRIYIRGVPGYPRDMGKAGGYLLKAAEQGHRSAQYLVGTMYRSGQGFTQDFETAVKWFRQAADKLHPQAQTAMGDAYYFRHGVERDYRKAIGWYSKAAARGEGRAQNSLGLMFAKGLGVPVNYKAAITWFEMGARSGDATAQSNLAEIYFRGKRGVPKDIEKAYLWSDIAIRMHEQKPALRRPSAVARNRELAAKELSEEQLTRIRQTIESCWLNPKSCP